MSSQTSNYAKRCDDKENFPLQVQRKCTNKDNFVDSSGTLTMHRPLARSHSQGVFTQSTQRCTEIPCHYWSSDMHMEDVEIPSLTDSINEHLHLSLFSIT